MFRFFFRGKGSDAESDGDDAPSASTPLRPRVAAIDVGSNSFHLLVVEAEPDGGLAVLEHTKEMVRFGEATLRDKVIPADAFDRGLRTLAAFKQMADVHRPEAIIAVATSSVREASNGATFVQAVAEKVGLEVRVIDSIEEARLIYLGARQALAPGSRRVLLLDVGGGSTEVLIADQSDCFFATSLRLGALRLRDEWRCSDPPTAPELSLAKIRARALAQPTTEHLRRIGFDFVALTSGTALAVARLFEDDLTPPSEPLPSGLQRLTAVGLENLERRLSQLTLAERAALPGLEPRRADTILTGTVIVRTLLDLLEVREAAVCDSALKHGVVVDYIKRRAHHAPARGEDVERVFGGGRLP
jgi:exopolyphosphatase / guanosine-5'-triphosphate,3'-diphosphate pyrophosphatase